MAYTPSNTTVWIEIPVTDLDNGIAFYSAATGLALNKFEMGPNMTAVFQSATPMAGVDGHLYVGKPATAGTGPTVHLAVEGTVEEAMARTSAAGGQVISDPIDLPDGRFAYAIDPDGNSIGLFERKKG